MIELFLLFYFICLRRCFIVRWRWFLFFDLDRRFFDTDFNFDFEYFRPPPFTSSIGGGEGTGDISILNIFTFSLLDPSSLFKITAKIGSCG